MSVESMTQYRGICDHCDEPAPDWRGSYAEADQDAADCPCGDE